MSEFPKIKLRAVRVNADYTLNEAAEKLGVSKNTLINYEHGITKPSWDMVKKMTELYNFPSDYIFFEKSTNF